LNFKQFELKRFVAAIAPIYYILTLSVVCAHTTSSETFFEEIQQPQKFGSIQVTSKPENGMTIFINDQNTGKTTPHTFDGITTGEYTIKLVSQWYQSQSKKVSIIDERTQLVSFTLRPLFAELTINATTDALIHINGEKVGSTIWTGRVMEGICRVKVDKQGFATQSFQLSILAGKNQKVDIKLKPVMGSIEVTSEPPGAIISIDGTVYGLTPFTIKNLAVGNYRLSLSKVGYTSIFKTVEVKESKVTSVALTLVSGKQVAIKSDPSAARIFLDDSLLGITPKSIYLQFGSHSLTLEKGNLKIVEKIEVTQTSPTNYEFKLKDSNDPLEKYLILVKGGTFKMGDTFGDGKKYEKPIRDVTLSDFYISKFEVTQALWKEIMGDSPSHFEGCEECPVERVSWNQVQEFLKKLNDLTGKEYRLPTEAEWEYAARGGEKSQGHRYSGAYNINDVAWYSGNSGNKPNHVGLLRPNELGIYDMSGNVWEWCYDWFAPYTNSPETNPKGPETGDGRVVRGGSWFGFIGACRLTFRGFDDPANSRSYIGFRVVLSLTTE
jgi:formylglycine-generating enzyme required for sulfatase activity